MEEMELPMAKEGFAQPFSLLGEAAVLGQPLVLPGRMFSTAHLQHWWCWMQLGIRCGDDTHPFPRSRHCWGRQRALLEMSWAFYEFFCV